MYHPSRGGVRGGRDQFKWEDVKADKHRENYLGHSVKAPVGRWQKGKDLNWYAKDSKSQALDQEAARAEIQKIKEEEEQAMREALGLAPKRANRPQGNRLDKHEFSELVKRGSTEEDLGSEYTEAERVQGLGYSRLPRSWTESSSDPASLKDVLPGRSSGALPEPLSRDSEEVPEDEHGKKRREEKRHEKHEKHKKRSRDSEDKRKHKREKGRSRHDSD